MTGELRNHDSTTASESPDDLFWLAYRYVAGECSEAEATAFEQQLAVDQTTREALAGAVRVVEAVYSLKPRIAEVTAPSARSIDQPVAARRSADLSGLLSLAMAVAVVVAIGYGLWMIPAVRHSKRDVALTQESGERRLVALWHSAGERPVDDTEAAAQDDAFSAEALAEADPDLDIPDWMFAGVLGIPEEGDANPEHEEIETF